MEIHDNFQTVITSNDVDQILSPLKPLGINYFHYGKVFKNGSVALLVSNVEWHKHVFQLEKPGPWPTTDKYMLESGCYLWESMYDKSLIQDANSYFDFNNGLVLVSEYDDYYDTFSFGLSKNLTNTVYEFFLTHLEILKQFRTLFMDRSRILINQAEKNKLVLPESMLKNTLFEKKREEINHLRRKVTNLFGSADNLTFRESECLEYLAKGKTMKEIAICLNISPRTVESHVNNMKKKLNCNFKTELADLYWTNYH